ncbi:hypothetical protein HBH98_035750 [Parastagonospora nodorum]|nr:hypothetical protein HBH53_010940 [Parastagonospora nodorum]KAH3986433.1 hypothetical protein HBH52_042140 [Parastagonospora nodorum]KAH3988354.1 hypothetical protein HBH51_006890 [Parastagonospora nodorum]KAH4040158.1 hypothetical protein HBI09_024470 [Parastagonospora nodorum]KAH4071524.1 hypothetical protein HBH50_081750 [Parastagonospora nodorum]
MAELISPTCSNREAMMLRAAKSSVLSVLPLASFLGMWNFTITSFEPILMDQCVYCTRMDLAGKTAMLERRVTVYESVPRFLTMSASIAVLSCASGLASSIIRSGATSNNVHREPE